MSKIKPPHREHNPITTYVLAGRDDAGAFSVAVANYKKTPGVVVIDASDYPSFADAIAQIKGPGNIVLAAHGSTNGYFQWNTMNTTISYNEGLSALKTLPNAGQGIGTITIGSCYGGLAAHHLDAIPTGTVLQSMVGSDATALDIFQTTFQIGIKGATNPTSLILEAIDNVSPKDYQRLYEAFSGTGISTEHFPKPEDLMPTIVGIGGNSPITINLDAAAQSLLDKTPDRGDFNSAVRMVKGRFDGNYKVSLIDTLEKDLGIPYKEMVDATKDDGTFDPAFVKKSVEALKKLYPGESINEANAEKYFYRAIDAHQRRVDKELDKEIERVADKMRKGEPVARDAEGNIDLEELRIRRALGIAYMETSGEMKRLINTAKESALEPEATSPPVGENREPQGEANSPATALATTTPAASPPSAGEVLNKYGLSKGDFPNFQSQNSGIVEATTASARTPHNAQPQEVARTA
ncbi:MAG: hypothetical protein SFW64_00360 [Alphaproteobacteria bacterium]|nr:hypothetical protein [Alphaproteobacteria bacterium]